MDHKAGYKISDKDKVPLCLIKRHVMSDVQGNAGYGYSCSRTSTPGGVEWSLSCFGRFNCWCKAGYVQLQAVEMR